MGLQEKIIQLETKLAQREHETAELIESYEARLEEKSTGEREGHRDIGDFMVLVWNFAQCRFLLLLVWTGIWIFFRDTPLPFWKVGPLGLVGASLLIVWCSAEVDETGWGRLTIKLIVYIAGYQTGMTWPFLVIPIVCVLALLLATKLTDNLCEWLKSVPLIGKFGGWLS